jgi:hypothetical protein
VHLGIHVQLAGREAEGLVGTARGINLK